MKKQPFDSLIPAGGLGLVLVCASSASFADSPPAPVPPATPSAAAKPADTAPADAAAPTTAEGSYLLGMGFGEQMRKFGITNEISVKDITRGITDALGGKKVEPSDQQRVQAFMKSVMQEIVAKNRAAAAKFLADNAHADGVKSLPSGLEYKVLGAGDPSGASPAPTDTVTVQYRGRLLNGTEFDSSYSRGQAATFPLNGVIKGWQEGVGLMKPGDKYELFVPPELAYDATPKPSIPPGSLLIFDVELVSVKPNPPATGAAPTNAPPATQSAAKQ